MDRFIQTFAFILVRLPINAQHTRTYALTLSPKPVKVNLLDPKLSSIEKPLVKEQCRATQSWVAV